MNDPTKVKIVPISSFIAVSIITIFSLYITNVIKTIPCGDTVLSSFYSNFLHIEPCASNWKLNSFIFSIQSRTSHRFKTIHSFNCIFTCI